MNKIKNTYKKVGIEYVDARVSTPNQTVDDRSDRYRRVYMSNALCHLCNFLL